jgi:acetyl-CoA acetyltransferase
MGKNCSSGIAPRLCEARACTETRVKAARFHDRHGIFEGNPLSFITGVGLTPYGKHPGRGTLDLMSDAAAAAIADAQLERTDVDGLVCGYSTTMPHLMLATVFAEHFGLKPSYAHAIQVGGATGFAMAMLAHHLVESSVARNILVVAGENRLTGQSRDSAIQTLAQVGHPIYEVPLGATIPAYYGLVASRYMHEHRHGEADLAELAVLMRRHAGLHPGAQFREPITVETVLASKPIASPLKLLDCCPVSDGGAAFVVSRDRSNDFAVGITGTGQAHTHQHISAAASLTRFGAASSAAKACEAAGVAIRDIDYAAIYDSFTITLTILLEEIGLARRGAAGRLAAEGHFNHDGKLPLNTHGGLLSYGHCGVGGAMAHLVETHLQLTDRAGKRQAKNVRRALLHGDGGVLSSHVSLVMERVA